LSGKSKSEACAKGIMFTTFHVGSFRREAASRTKRRRRRREGTAHERERKKRRKVRGG
jgi:hypothetical protein